MAARVGKVAPGQTVVRLRSRIGWYFLAGLIPAICWPAPAIPPTINLDWSKRTYHTAAPPPFDDVQVTMAVDTVRRVTSLEIWVGDSPVEVPHEVYAELVNPSEIDIAYADPTQTSTETVEYVVVAFEVGDSYRIEYEAEIAGCDSPCFDTVRDIVQIRVNADLSIVSKISSLRHELGVGPP